MSKVILHKEYQRSKKNLRKPLFISIISWLSFPSSNRHSINVGFLVTTENDEWEGMVLKLFRQRVSVRS